MIAAFKTLFRGKPKSAPFVPRERWDLDTPVYRFNDKGDQWTIRDLCTGMLTLGGPGSGKSSCVMSLFRDIVLHHGFGGMVLCVKPGEARAFIEAAKRH